MILREIIPILIASACLSPIAAAQKVFPSPSTIPPSSTVEHPQDFSEIGAARHGAVERAAQFP